MTRELSVQHILFDSATRLIPQVFGALMFIAGALLLATVLTPIDPTFMPYVKTWLPLGLVELSRTGVLSITRGAGEM